MSRISIQGDSLGTGTFTIAAPNSNTDRTLTLPDAAGELLTTTGDGSGLTGISSYADSDALSLFNVTGAAPVYACRAWVNFNGQGTVAIRASGNVSSITDVTTGQYRVNFATALADANYSAVGSGRTNELGIGAAADVTTSGFAVETFVSNGTFNDPSHVFCAVFR